ncbi:hypothetical protein [Actinokineospora enzanensis]|uniref:hypothetical protein n=1 Tax=Actinokineospora enzanensis TaxID=155975 RepID=UPI000527A55C|nr:hypothetical protein [Actinokineospora enzanensis]
MGAARLDWRVWSVGAAVLLASAACATPVAGSAIAAPVTMATTSTTDPSEPPETSDAPEPSATSASSEPSVTTESAPATTSVAPVTLGDPGSVVNAYFDAINAHDYQRAWDLGGKNTGKSYTDFAAGFAGTDHDEISIETVQGGTVTLGLTAYQTDGSHRTFHGTYTVTGGTITSFAVRATG